MSFMLYMSVQGLCMFVHDNQELHVLMPKTDSGCAKHVARVYYDEGYRTGSPPQRQLEFAPFDGGALTVDVPAGIAEDLKPLDAILPLIGDVRPECLYPDPGDLLNARLTLPAGDWAGHSKGECWSIKDAPSRELTFRVGWGIRIDDTELRWRTAALGSGSVPSIPRLFPAPDGKLVLHVYHSITAELPEKHPTPTVPFPRERPHHIDCYDKLFTGPVVPKVQFIKALPCDELGKSQPPVFNELFSASTLSCMVSVARPIG
ncbi:MAG: hypothetical protein JWM27_2842 [Gemmatimonadetes bacterium]|nr:hypothetical protein [Gemmatimonadota bacterium]